MYIYSCKQDSASIIFVDQENGVYEEQIFPLMGVCDVLVHGKNSFYVYPQKPVEVYVFMNFFEDSYGPRLSGGQQTFLRFLRSHFDFDTVSENASVFLEFCCLVLDPVQPTRVLLAKCRKNSHWKKTRFSIKEASLPAMFQNHEQVVAALEESTQSSVPLISDFRLCLELCMEEFKMPEEKKRDNEQPGVPI